VRARTQRGSRESGRLLCVTRVPPGRRAVSLRLVIAGFSSYREDPAIFWESVAGRGGGGDELQKETP